MTTSEDLSPEAKHLLRQAKGADRATRSEVAGSVQRFRSSPVPRSWRPRAASPAPRRVTPWAVLVAVLSGTLGAYATVGQSLGLPMPGWWPEFATLPAFIDITTGRSTAAIDDPLAPATAFVGSGEVPSVNTAAPVTVATPVNIAAPVAVGATADTTSIAPSEPAGSPTSLPASARQPSSRALGERGSQAGNAERVAASPAPAASSSLTAGPLAREVQIITAARDALNAGNCTVASSHLDAHRLQFPTGALSEERQALSAICQCRQGRGTSAAAAYVARRPNSPLARRVATECGSSKQ